MNITKHYIWCKLDEKGMLNPVLSRYEPYPEEYDTKESAIARLEDYSFDVVLLECYSKC